MKEFQRHNDNDKTHVENTHMTENEGAEMEIEMGPMTIQATSRAKTVTDEPT